VNADLTTRGQAGRWLGEHQSGHVVDTTLFTRQSCSRLWMLAPRSEVWPRRARLLRTGRLSRFTMATN
jgi:hypothetical protein